MTDIFTKKKRGLIMASVKSKGSKIEKVLASFLRRNRIKFRSHPNSLPGRPDFVMKDHKAVMFADSCFWHGCRLHGSIPKSNKTFWQNKIDRNKKRDRTVNRAYSQMDMKVIRVWEHDIKPDLLDKKLKWLLDTLGQ